MPSNNWYDLEGWTAVSDNEFNPFSEPNEQAAPKPFYSASNVSSQTRQPSKSVNKQYDLNNPVSIYKYLRRFVYNQDDYVKNLSVFLYNHIHERSGTVMLVTGPPGNGKTYAAKKLKEIYPSTVIWDASTLSKDGWNGANKLQDVLKESIKYEKPIIVLDEFDKLCQPLYSHESNTSLAMQAEFLKLFECEKILLKSNNKPSLIDTSKFSFLLLGSFSEKAEEIAEKKSSKGIGFGSIKNDMGHMIKT